MASYPQMFRLRQKFMAPRIEEVQRETDAELTRLDLAKKIRPGQTVAITAGSRGITNIHIILRAVVQHLEQLGAKPLIVPAMGSHGGGNAEGQRRIIESYGITENFCGCPIRSSTETAVVFEADEGFQVHFDRTAYEADHVMICGRIKPHTMFAGDIESGLMKMLLIGLGNHEGAKIYHRAISDYSFAQIIESVAGRLIESCNIVAGLAIIENAHDETAQLTAVEPHEFFEREKQLLGLARKWMPRLPFQRIDLLIVDEIGKNISGTGMDTNIVGRKFNDNKAAPDEFPKCKRIMVRSLSDQSHGNALGIGIADFCRSRVMDQADIQATRLNALACGHLSAATVPIDFTTDREILDAALPTIGLTEPSSAKIVWIRNTRDLSLVACSAPFFQESHRREDLEILSELSDFPLDAEGNLPPFPIGS